MAITAAQVRAVYDELSLDHDLTLAVTITPGRVYVTTAETDENGAPVVTGGVLQRVETGYEIEQEVPHVDA